MIHLNFDQNKLTVHEIKVKLQEIGARVVGNNKEFIVKEVSNLFIILIIMTGQFYRLIYICVFRGISSTGRATVLHTVG